MTKCGKVQRGVNAFAKHCLHCDHLHLCCDIVAWCQRCHHRRSPCSSKLPRSPQNYAAASFYMNLYEDSYCITCITCVRRSSGSGPVTTASKSNTGLNECASKLYLSSLQYSSKCTSETHRRLSWLSSSRTKVSRRTLSRTFRESSTSESLARRNLMRKPSEKVRTADSSPACRASRLRLLTHGPSFSHPSGSSLSSGPLMSSPGPVTCHCQRCWGRGPTGRKGQRQRQRQRDGAPTRAVVVSVSIL